MARRHRRAPAYLSDPLAPLPEPVLQRRVRRNINAQTNPVIRQIEARARSGAQNISGISEALAGRLSGGQAATADIYQRARDSLGATDRALQSGLTTQGSGIADALGKRVASAGGDPAILAALQAASAGAVGAQGVRGSAELGQLTLKQAAGEQYAQQMPGFARLSGLQGIRDLQARKSQQLGDVAARVPGSVAQALSSARRQEYEKAVAARGFGVDYERIAQQDRATSQRASTASQAEAGRNARAAATNAETERHNRNAEAISKRGGNTTAASAREARRHNRAMEKISKGKGLSQKKGGSLLP